MNARHGGPNDRGASDAWYRRPYNPHYYEGGTYSTPEITRENMTEKEIAEYKRGFDEIMASGDHKDYG